MTSSAPPSPPHRDLPGVDPDALAAVRDLVARAERPVVLTGAGMSAESGVPTFRDAQVGLWERYSPEQLATEEAFLADPALVWSWYLWRARLVRSVEPNAGHRAVAAWQGRVPALAVATQNVDDLHERPGADVLAHLHGSLFAFRCAVCGAPAEVDVARPGDDGHAPGPGDDPDATPRREPPRCTVCREGLVRPGVVWFGESLPAEQWDATWAALEACDLCVVVGTSGLVQPAATLPFVALGAGAPVVEVNPRTTELTSAVTHHLRGTAAAVLPALLA